MNLRKSGVLFEVKKNACIIPLHATFQLVEMWMPASMAMANSLRPLLESVASMAARLGIGLTKAWGLVRDRKVEAVYLDNRTLVVVESTDRLVAQLRAEARSREPSEWSQRCGPLASTANKGRRRARTPLPADQ
jgi:hypothetical protein